MKLIITSLIVLVLSAFLFLLIMYFLKKKNFTKNGERKNDWRKLTPELLSAEIRYHNEAVYKAFEFYIKLTLALFGAIGVAAVSKDYNPKNISLIIEYLGFATISVTLLFCFIYISHQKAKIERWNKGFKWYDPFWWNECWLFSISLSIAVTVNYFLIPKLIENL